MEDINVILDRAIVLNTDKKWKELVEFLPDSVLKTYKNPDLYAEKAQALYFLKDFSESKKLAEKALEISSNAKAYHCLGKINLENEDFSLAEDYFRKAIQSDSNYLPPFYGLGLIYRRKKEFKIAEDYLKKALEVDLLNTATYNALGNLYVDLEYYLAAEECFKKSLEIDSNYTFAYTGLGNVAVSKEDYNLAKEYYLKGIEIDPTNAIQHYNLGLVYNLLNEKKSAEKHFKKAIALDDKYALAFNGLGNTCKNSNRYKEAEEYYKKAISLKPSYDIAYYNLALLYYDNDNIVEAKKIFEEYLICTQDRESFIYKNALSKIEEINRKIENSSYKKISKIINQIKELLLFKGECISHYTSITTVQFLLLKESPFRLSEGTFLNDTSEGEELFKFLEVSNGNVKKNHSEIFTKRPFIGSFVDAAKNNDLTLWRMYGKEGLEEAKGCSITLNIKEFKTEIKNKINKKEGVNALGNRDIEFYRVVYRNGEEFCFSGATPEINTNLTSLMNNLKLELNRFYKKASHKNDELEIVELLNEIAYLFKSVEYQYENEIRLVINEAVGFDKKIDFNESNFIPSSDPIKVYIELVSIASLLKTITIGPKVDRAEEWGSTFHYFLTNKELKTEIQISKLPFK